MGRGALLWLVGTFVWCTGCRPSTPSGSESTSEEGTAGAETTTGDQGDADGGGEAEGESSTGDSGADASSTGDGETGSDFIPPIDHLETFDPCDPTLPPAESCGRGFKCAPLAPLTGTYYESFACAPVSGEQQAGEACELEAEAGKPVADDCGPGLSCHLAWNFWESVPLVQPGVCMPFCTAGEEGPTCPNGMRCEFGSDGTPMVCRTPCDPTAQDCTGDMACQLGGEAFECDLGGSAALGEPCDLDTPCESGSACRPFTELAQCSGTSCCTAYCEVGADPDSCPTGSQCQPHPGGLDPLPAGYEHVGLCQALP